MHIGSGVDYCPLAKICDAMVKQVIWSGCDIQAILADGGGEIIDPLLFGKSQLILTIIMLYSMMLVNVFQPIWGII